MRRSWLGMAFGVLACAAALPVAAQQAAPAPADEAQPSQDGGIVVRGQKQEPIAQARRFVRQVVQQKDARLARFEDPVCVQVAGLAPKHNEAVADRFRTVAQVTGVPLAPEACSPNVLVLIVENSDAFVKLARKKYRKVFSQLTDTDLRHALAEGPVRSWRNVVTIDEMGRQINTERFGFVDKSGYDPANIAALEAGDAPPIQHRRETHASTVNSVIILEKAVTRGKSVMQIADYAAMRTLVGARPPKKGSIASASILSLFDADASPAPVEISDMDLGLLGGLYALDTPTENADIALARISKGMVAPAKPEAKDRRRRD